MKKLQYFKSLVLFLVFFILLPYTKFSLTLSEAINEGLRNNPDIKASFWYLKYSLDKKNAADAGYPTMIRFGILNIPSENFSFNNDMMTQVIFGIKQKFYFFGKLSLKKEIANEMQKIAQYDYEGKKRRLKSLIKTTYYKILYLKNVIKLTKETIRLLKQFKKIAQTRYSVGKGLFQDMTKANFEVSRLKEKIIILNDKKRKAGILLNRLIGRKNPIPLTKIEKIKIQFPDINLAKLQNFAFKKAIEIKLSNVKLKKAKLKMKLAKRMRWPNFALGSSYGLRTKNNTSNLFSINFELNMPIFSKRSKEISAISKLLKQKKQHLESAKQNIYKIINTLFTAIITEKKLYDLYSKELIPLAKLSLSSAISSYQVGKIEFLSLVTAQLLLYRYQIINENNIRKLLTHYAHLEFFTDIIL